MSICKILHIKSALLIVIVSIFFQFLTAQYQLSQTLCDRRGTVTSVAFSSDNQTFAMALNKFGYYSIVIFTRNHGGIWSYSQTLDHDSNGHSYFIKSIDLSPDGKTLVSGSWDRTIKIWSLCEDQWICVQTIDPDLSSFAHSINLVKLSPDGQTLVSVAHDSTIKIWVLNRDKYWELAQSFQCNAQCIDSLEFSSDGNMIAFAESDRIKILFFNKGKWSYAQTLGMSHRGSSIYSLALSPNGRTIISGSSNSRTIIPGLSDKTIKISQTNDEGQWESTQTFEVDNMHNEAYKFVTVIKFSPEGRTFACGTTKGIINIFSLDENEQWYCNRIAADKNSSHGCRITSLAFSPDGDFFISGSSDGFIKIWALNDQGWYCKQTLAHNSRYIEELTFLSDEQSFISILGHGTVEIWKKKSELLMSTETENRKAEAEEVHPWYLFSFSF